MKKMIFVVTCLGLLSIKYGGDSALAATNESLSKSTVVINNEEMYERSANFTKILCK